MIWQDTHTSGATNICKTALALQGFKASDTPLNNDDFFFLLLCPGWLLKLDSSEGLVIGLIAIYAKLTGEALLVKNEKTRFI